jgi:hypothetical protein
VKLWHHTPPELKKRIREAVINLIENEDVNIFLVGEAGGYEIDAYDVVLEVQKEYPHILIYFVISKVTDLNVIGYSPGYEFIKRGFDDFIFPPECEFGYKKLCLVYRNRYIIGNTDVIVAYNKYQGRAYDFCRSAAKKGVKVIELADDK